VFDSTAMNRMLGPKRGVNNSRIETLRDVDIYKTLHQIDLFWVIKSIEDKMGGA
jgi:hypothetical protein